MWFICLLATIFVSALGQPETLGQPGIPEFFQPEFIVDYFPFLMGPGGKNIGTN